MQLAARSEVPAIPLRWAQKIITRMHTLYGAHFARQWEGLDAASMAECWSEELAGFTPEEIARGLDACKARTFPPTLPEFLTMCRPPLVPDVAFHEAVAGMVARQRGDVGTWSHPAIYWAAVKVGSGDVLALGYGALKSRWEAALRDQLAAGDWPAVPTPAPALPPPGGTRTTREEASKRLSELGAAGLVKRAPSSDARRWARTLLNRKDRGERISPVAEAKARLALGESGT
jgi:hypothetical protein